MYNPEKEKVVVFIIIAVHSWGLLVQRVRPRRVRSCGNPQQITNILRRRHYGNTDIAAVSSPSSVACKEYARLKLQGIQYSNSDLGGGIVKGGGDEGSGGER